jgi:transposase, IS5 family
MRSKKRASNPSYVSPSQLGISGFQTPFSNTLDQDNRWVKMAHIIPWDPLVSIYNKQMKTGGRPGLNPRIIIGALLIKHLCNLSDRETIDHIQENIYMQYFLGYSSFKKDAPFDPTLFVEIRDRLGMEGVNAMNDAIIKASGAIKTETDQQKKDKEKGIDEGDNKGRVLFDATICPQDISYPTDLGLLNEAREKTEQIIDVLYNPKLHVKKPRTYRIKARKVYLSIAKKKIKHRKVVRKAIGKQLRFLKRNLASIDKLLDSSESSISLSRAEHKYLMVSHTLYQQQKEMFDKRIHSIEDRIVSIHQPHVRPMKRGKARTDTEFGAKINVALVNGFAFLDELSWNAFNEGKHLITYIEQYKNRFGYYPKEVLADKIYCNRENRAYMKERRIKLLSKPLGRPSAVREHVSPGERNPIEGKFGQAKTTYGMDRIKARLKDTSQTWIALILMVTNLVKLTRSIPYSPIEMIVAFSARLELIAKKISRIVYQSGLNKFNYFTFSADPNYKLFTSE